VNDALHVLLDLIQRHPEAHRLRGQPPPPRRVVGDQDELPDVVQKRRRDRVLLRSALRQDRGCDPGRQSRMALKPIDREPGTLSARICQRPSPTRSAP
jgi:hypothetical protein